MGCDLELRQQLRTTKYTRFARPNGRSCSACGTPRPREEVGRGIGYALTLAVILKRRP